MQLEIKFMKETKSFRRCWITLMLCL